MKNRLLLFLVAVPILLNGQPDTTGQHRMIKGLVEYRNELITRDTEGLKQLYRLEELWKVEDKEAITDMLSGVTSINKRYGASANEIVLAAQIMANDSFKYRQLLTTDIVQTIIDNDDLAMLLSDGILKQSPPFGINPETPLYKELAFYKIENGMSIAEIGAGNGMFSLMLGLAFDSLSIYVNDINNYLINLSFDRINRCKSIRPSNKYYLTEGKNKSTKLESYKLDKVIIRNAFHHFLFKKKMLASIKKSLSPMGDLYITDPNKGQGKPGTCQVALTAEKIKEVLLQNGFRVVEERQLDEWGWVMLHCKPN